MNAIRAVSPINPLPEGVSNFLGEEIAVPAVVNKIVRQYRMLLWIDPQ
jgi:hypothetical protein